MKRPRSSIPQLEALVASRRGFVLGSASLVAAGCTPHGDEGGEWIDVDIPEARAITRGPRHHWFGYYDKLEFDPTNRFVLSNEVEFEGRTPDPTDVLRVGMVDLESGDEWIELGQSTAWSWQQGCMLQWIPGDSTRVIWNDRDGDAFVSRILDTANPGAGIVTLPRPIFCLTSDGTTAFTIDYARVHDIRSGYGYAGGVDPVANELAPDSNGIWRMDIATGTSTLIYSIADAAALDAPTDGWPEGAKHWVYHLLVSTDRTRLSFLHCYKTSQGGIWCRMITTDLDGGRPFVLDPYGKTSHYDWRDGNHVLAWSWQGERGWAFWLFEDQTSNAEAIGPGTMVENGHCTYLADRRWILNDTYPDDEGFQHPFLFDTETGGAYSLGDFLSPTTYRGEFRCDNHPRSSRDGRLVVIDSPHQSGRQMYLLDVADILDSVS